MQKLNKCDIPTSHFGNLVLTLYCYYRDKELNHGLFQSTCFWDSYNMAIEKNLSGTISLYKKQCSVPVITYKTSSKQVAPIKYTLEKNIFTVATYEATLCVVSF